MSSVFDKKPTCSIQVGFSYSFCVLSILSCIKEVYKGVFHDKNVVGGISASKWHVGL